MERYDSAPKLSNFKIVPVFGKMNDNDEVSSQKSI